MFKKIMKRALYMLMGTVVVAGIVCVIGGIVYLMSNIHINSNMVAIILTGVCCTVWIFMMLCAVYSIGKDICYNSYGNHSYNQLMRLWNVTRNLGLRQSPCLVRAIKEIYLVQKLANKFEPPRPG